jgi:type I restriction enzyme M protein
MALKKSALYSSLWRSCDELRGGMDASQYKDYVLTLLFVKYVSDKYSADPYALLTVPEGGSFADMVRLKGDKEIGDKVNKIIGRLAEANNLKGVIDVADFNDEDKLGRGQDMVDRLSNLIAIFDGIDLRANQAGGDDLLGDAYEYLMRHFATESGKSKGQFYTPAEVSRVMAKLLGIGQGVTQDRSVYDPTCGSGSLLLKVSAEAPHGLSIYGQEMDNATAALARMNMILHDQPTAEIWQDNTLTNPHWRAPEGGLKTFDFVVANPPFSQKNWTNGLNPAHDEFGRFALGIPPAKNGDYAFLLHVLRSLKSTGRAAVIMPHGVLFRGNAEAVIRRGLIERRVIQGIIGLPPNLFYGTGIPACIVVLDKAGAQDRTGIFMIDASRGFMKDGNKNRLRSQDIHKIVDVFRRRLEVPRYARHVPFDEIARNDNNLNLPRYIDAGDPEDLHDLDAHLNGGLPQRDVDALDAYWCVLPGVREALFAPAGAPWARPGYLATRLPAHAVKPAILKHPAFVAFADRLQARFDDWRSRHMSALTGLTVGSAPQDLIHTLAEDLLVCSAGAALVDKYDVYQHLMDYWADVMQDDVYTIAQVGWMEAAKLQRVTGQDKPDFVVGRQKLKADLIPPHLMVARFFAAEQAALDGLQAALDAATQELDAFIEENTGEEGLLEDAKTDKDKITKGSLKTRLGEITFVADSDDEHTAILRCQELMDAVSDADKAVKDAQRALDAAVFARYGTLTEGEIKALVVQDKWLATLAAALQDEMARVTQHLAVRVQALEERYADPLPALTAEVARLAARVNDHLHRMGLAWGDV